MLFKTPKKVIIITTREVGEKTRGSQLIINTNEVTSSTLQELLMYTLYCYQKNEREEKMRVKS